MSEIEQHEEAAKALEVGKKALDAGMYDKAVKLLEKSLRMRKTAEAEALLQCAKKGVARAEAKRAAPEPVTPNANGHHSHSTQQPAAAASAAAKDTRPYTKEQEDACRIVISAKTHYETLSIEKTATVEEIKKTYRKLALKFHPDKNSAPSADEAFKKISKAFKVLLDPDERAHYDRYGSDRDNSGGVAAHHHRSPFNQYDDFHNMDPDDLLRWFMGGGLGGGMGGFGGPNIRVHHFGGRFGGPRARAYQQQRRAEETQPGVSLQHLLSLFLMLVFFLSSFASTADPSNRAYKAPSQVYALSPDKQFTIRRKTTMSGVVGDIPYYVDSKFASTIGRSPRDLYYVERDVESGLYNSLKEKCQSEVAFKSKQIYTAQATSNKDAMDAALKMETPSCVLQADLERKRRK